MPASFHAVLRVALVIAIITPGVAEEIHTHASPVIVGTVTFPISCSKEAQSHIESGLAVVLTLRKSRRVRQPPFVMVQRWASPHCFTLRSTAAPVR
jgi:hypothetical protein